MVMGCVWMKSWGRLAGKHSLKELEAEPGLSMVNCVRKRKLEPLRSQPLSSGRVWSLSGRGRMALWMEPSRNFPEWLEDKTERRKVVTGPFFPHFKPCWQTQLKEDDRRLLSQLNEPRLKVLKQPLGQGCTAYSVTKKLENNDIFFGTKQNHSKNRWIEVFM